MTEKLLQAIWGFQYFNRSELFTTSGEKVQILFPGTKNTNQGPDFLDARIKLGETVMAGSIELHLKTSEWNKHKHGYDSNYNNVILHVVLENDVPRINHLPVLELKNRISNLLLQHYSTLMEEVAFIPCAQNISSIKPLTFLAWQERMVAERLTRKAIGILSIFEKSGNHWEETGWQLLARNFGTKVNGDAFENLARNVPFKLIAKHKNNLQQIEALLFGSAGLLSEEGSDEYGRLLWKEYLFLQKKYNLQPIIFPVHFLRMRPQNFPTVRLAQLAALAHKSDHLFSKMVEMETVQSLKQWLAVVASDYWNDHYRFGEPSHHQPKKLGNDMIHNIIINTLAPLLFAYGIYHRKEEVKNRAIEWLQQTPAETNVITKGFLNISIDNTNAFQSQALIEMKNEYCNYRRCLDCAVGNALLKKWNSPL